ncbi:NECAP-like protein CG9132 [Vespa velutina]|uniref:NECAP-like protein CG9132 n=1 Tax=Vespa crabro TaxID=7445 RepID=UPI001EFFD7E5|nr:NECAP-like protein CG9132 [Vespa crabro]XP_046824158.1 NECAP-like protein CG9132 [Vespa crabro]XP_047358945.1 NECAP-like protein CG9132 [Vespa velutina]
METYESVLLVKSEVFVFKIPPRSTNRGYRAADWNLQEPSWTGRMRLVSQGDAIAIKLEDKITGELFAKCPIEQYPGIAVEPVTDSSRYFVLRIQNDNGRSAFIGVGFLDRSDSFDLNVALQDHFKWLKNRDQIEKEKETPKQELDLRFKEGETIKINMKITKKDGSEVVSKSKQRPNLGVGLPPPPGGVKIAPPPAKTPTSSPAHKSVQNPNQASTGSEWGEFASASQQSSGPSTTVANASWVQF